MKWLIVVLMVACMVGNANAGAFDAVDAENKRVAEFVRDAVNPGFEDALKKENPSIMNFEWGARGQPYDADNMSVTYLIYCEGKNKEAKSVGFWYMELTVSMINGNNKLINKYGLTML